MSMFLMAKAMGIKVGNPTRKLVLLKLADNANDDGMCFPSYQHIADQCEISRRSAMSHIEELCNSRLIRKVCRKNGDRNSSNVYYLDLDGENSAPPEEISGENVSLGGETDSLGGGENISPRTYHSSEPVNEPSLSDTRDEIFNRPDPADEPLPDSEKRFSMHRDWIPNEQHLGVELLRRGLPSSTRYETGWLSDFTSYYTDKPGRQHSEATWNCTFAKWIQQNIKRQQQIALTSASGGTHNEKSQSAPRKRLSASEARARDEALKAGGSGRVFDSHVGP